VKVLNVTLGYEDGSVRTFTRGVDAWLFIVQANDEYRCVGLSGDDVTNSFLLKVLDVFVIQQMQETHRMMM
jgi:hypothetical protein